MPKSSSFTLALGGDQDVGGLQVAVDHQVAVRVLHGVAATPSRSRRRAATSRPRREQ